MTNTTMENDKLKVGAMDIHEVAMHVAFHVALDKHDVEEVRKVLTDYALLIREIAEYQKSDFANSKEWNTAARILLNPNLSIQIVENAKETIEAKRGQDKQSVKGKSKTGRNGKQIV